jgi:hypothetical protein
MLANNELKTTGVVLLATGVGGYVPARSNQPSSHQHAAGSLPFAVSGT